MMGSTNERVGTAAPRPLQVLVTGASGFVGRAVVRELLRRGHAVTATTTRLVASLPSDPKLCWVEWDALRQSLPAVAWETTDAVLHLACPAGPFAFPGCAPALYELTVAASFRLLEKARQAGIPRVLLASTGDVFGNREEPATEDDTDYRPNSFYGSAKACAEVLFRSYSPVLSTAILRIYHPYGPGGDRFLINRMVGRVAQGQEITLEGPNGIQLNPVWNEDLAVGIRLAVESAASGVFHFAGPDLVTLREMLEMIGALIRRPPVLRVKPVTAVAQHAGLCAQTRARLGYAPRVGLRDGLARLVQERVPAAVGVSGVPLAGAV
jgi:nucleoside-diphosphate-sugar epimerase